MPTLTTTKWTPVETGYEVSDIVVPATPRTYLTLCLRDKERFHVNRPKLTEQFGRYVPKRNGGRLARINLDSTPLFEAQKATPIVGLVRAALDLQRVTHDTFNRELIERGTAMSLLQTEWIFDQEKPLEREETTRGLHFVVANEEGEVLVADFRLWSPESRSKQTTVGVGDIHSRSSIELLSKEVLYFLVP